MSLLNETYLDAIASKDFLKSKGTPTVSSEEVDCLAVLSCFSDAFWAKSGDALIVGQAWVVRRGG